MLSSFITICRSFRFPSFGEGRGGEKRVVGDGEFGAAEVVPQLGHRSVDGQQSLGGDGAERHDEKKGADTSKWALSGERYHRRLERWKNL